MSPVIPATNGPTSPINPLDGAQTGDYVVVKEAVEDPVLLGTPKQIVYIGGTVRLGAFGRETVERYHVANGQEAAARAYMEDCLKDQTCMEAERTKTQGDNIEITVTWAYDRDDDAWQPGADAVLWDFDVIDTSQPLQSHPYFGRRILNDADQEILMREMGYCDQFLALGKPYKIQAASPSAAVQAIMERYAGLRYSGVDEWQPVLLMLQCRYRLYPSQLESSSGTDEYTWPDLLFAINRVVDLAAWAPPAHILKAIDGLGALSYSSEGSTYPDIGGPGFVWIRQKPQVRLSGKNPNGPSDVVDFLLGVQQASVVLYPSFDPDVNQGLWDPQRDVMS